MRRFFQFRLRTALVLMSLAALSCGWLSAQGRQWQMEQKVLAKIGPAAITYADRPLTSADRPLLCFL